MNLNLELINKNSIKLTFKDFNNNFNNAIRIKCEREEILNLINILTPYSTKIKKEDRAYTEEISTYKNEVERTLSLSGKKENLFLNLICYTNIPYDDNWIILTISKINYLLGLLYGYL